MRLFHKIFFFISLSILTTCVLSFVPIEELEVSVIKSLVDPQTIKNYAEKNYSFEGPIKSSILSLGVNDMYLIETAGGKYVLRLSRAEKYTSLTPAEFLFELNWLEYLNQHQVPVSYPIRRQDKTLCGLIQAPEGLRYATLFSYGAGTTEMNVEQALIFGKALAQLHMVSDSFEEVMNSVDLDIDHLIYQPAQRIKDFLQVAQPEKCVHLDELVEQLAQDISTMEITKGGIGIIAGDVHGQNQHFTADNQLTMFDFEFCAYGYRLYDLATFKWNRGARHADLWGAFLAGYQSERVLTEAEISAIDIFVKARNLWWMGALIELKEYQHKLDHKFWERAFSQF